MNKNEIFRKVGNIITELNEQYQYLSQNPDKLNDLELELFLANSSFLNDHIEILRKLNVMSVEKPAPEPVTLVSADVPMAANAVIEQPVTANQEVPTHEQKDEVEEASGEEKTAADPLTSVASDKGQKDEVKEVSRPFAFTDEETDAFDYEKKKVDELFDRRLTAEEQQIIERKKQTRPDVHRFFEPVTSPVTPATVASEEETVKEVIIPEKVIVTTPTPVSESPKEAAPVTINDTAAPGKTINEMISDQRAATVASRFTQQPTTDLKSGISLNDKLLFVKDLFNGYSLAYSEAIELLNRFDTIEAADNFLKLNYAGKNNWEAKPETVEKFYEILNRRFA